MYSKLKTSILMVLLCVAAPLAQRFAARQGDFWTGGSFGFASAQWSGGNNRQNVVNCDPIARFFPLRGLFAGPKISWTGEYLGTYTSNNVGLGADCGYMHAGSVSYYCFTSPHYVFSMNGSSYGKTGAITLWLPAAAGILIAAGSSLGVQLEIGYGIGFNKSQRVDAYTIGLGVCGFGTKTLISVVNAMRIASAAF
jgi:hypothetical protein